MRWLVLLSLLPVACGGAAAKPWERVTPGDLTPEEAERVETAGGIALGLVMALMKRLQDAVAEDGFAAAVSVCREAAPEIATKIAEHAGPGVRIGRTAVRLRNPNNAPPPWAATALGSPDRAVFRSPEGTLGVLLPIRLIEMCTTCHGTETQIPGDVAHRLAELYPEDRATGFAPGELRGHFWVEVPAAE